MTGLVFTRGLTVEMRNARYRALTQLVDCHFAVADRAVEMRNAPLQGARKEHTDAEKNDQEVQDKKVCERIQDHRDLSQTFCAVTVWLRLTVWDAQEYSRPPKGIVPEDLKKWKEGGGRDILDTLAVRCAVYSHQKKQNKREKEKSNEKDNKHTGDKKRTDRKEKPDGAGGALETAGAQDGGAEKGGGRLL